ncbi:MAG: hypothetical protein KDD43_15340 [Bdellovibrionales bacterium]|nr:hypothetical protein [Bdellovibrionales bacterium]
MNKLVIALAMIFTLDGWAATNVDITFTTDTNLTVKAVYRISVKGSKIFFDSEQIDPVQIPQATMALSRLSSTKADPLKPCSAGTYIHTVKKGKRTTRAKGCLDSVHALELVDAISQFQRLYILKK